MCSGLKKMVIPWYNQSSALVLRCFHLSQSLPEWGQNPEIQMFAQYVSWIVFWILLFRILLFQFWIPLPAVWPCVWMWIALTCQLSQFAFMAILPFSIFSIILVAQWSKHFISSDCSDSPIYFQLIFFLSLFLWIWDLFGGGWGGGL